MIIAIIIRKTWQHSKLGVFDVLLLMQFYAINLVLIYNFADANELNLFLARLPSRIVRAPPKSSSFSGLS